MRQLYLSAVIDAHDQRDLGSTCVQAGNADHQGRVVAAAAILGATAAHTREAKTSCTSTKFLLPTANLNMSPVLDPTNTK